MEVGGGKVSEGDFSFCCPKNKEKLDNRTEKHAESPPELAFIGVFEIDEQR